MSSPTALPLIQYHASLVAPAWGPHPDPLELDGQFLRVRNVDIREELGQPWRMTVEVMTNHPHFDPSRLAGADFSLHMLREDAANPAENDGRFFHGVVMSTEYIGAFAEAYHARLVVQPAVAMLEHTRRCRIFQDVTVVEIAQQLTESVLGEKGGELDISRLTADYPVRDYCVQYDETDLAFMRRVLAEEGITIAFEADEAYERTVLFDNQDQFGSVLRTVEGLDDNPPPQHVPVRGERGELADEETIASFTWQHRVHSSHGEREQWDWKQAAPGQLHASIEPEEVSPRHGGSFYGHGGRRLQEDAGGDGPHLDDSADRLGRQHALFALDANLFDGSSNVLSMVPGATFELDGHPDTELNGPYYCLRVTHSADNAYVELGAEGGTNYDNRFLCAPLEQAFSPHVPARPRIFGMQTATVVGPEEIHTDEYGRIKVRMHWDREQRDRDDDTSCWLRVVQSWAGAGFGTQFIPRVGMEVLINFLGGDPDRPVCVGSVYNGSHTPPYSLPENKTQSGIKTRSSPDSDGFNELRFEDAAGKEEVYFHAQRDHNERVENAHSQSVGASQSVNVGSNQSLSVGGNRSVSVTGNQTITVTETKTGPSNHVLDVQGSIDMKSATSTVTVEAKEAIELKCGTSVITITPTAISISAGGGSSVDLGEAIGMITAKSGMQVAMDPAGWMSMTSISGSSATIDGDIQLQSKDQATVLLTRNVLAETKAKGRVEVSDSVELRGSNIVAQASKARIEMSKDINGTGDTVKLATDTTTLELAKPGATVTGTKVDLTGIGTVNILAPNVKIN